MKDRVLLLAIDVQQDFMDDGALGVPGAYEDTARLVEFIQKNRDEITETIVSVDTHHPMQIFHPCWWVDKNGKNPEPYTAITASDVENGKYRAVSCEKESLDYVKNLELLGKKTLVIWPYHCLQSTQGAALENNFAKTLQNLSIEQGMVVRHIIKGLDPLSEMYGIIKPEYSREDYTNTKLLENFRDFDKIYVAGQAKSHCVLESVRQILEYYENEPDVTGRIHILTDCMSSIPGFEDVTEAALNGFKEKYNIKLAISDCL